MMEIAVLPKNVFMLLWKALILVGRVGEFCSFNEYELMAEKKNVIIRAIIEKNDFFLIYVIRKTQN